MHYTIKNYSATLLIGRMASPKKVRKYKICTIVFLRRNYTTCYASAELDFYLQHFKKLFKTATLAK